METLPFQHHSPPPVHFQVTCPPAVHLQIWTRAPIFAGQGYPPPPPSPGPPPPPPSSGQGGSGGVRSIFCNFSQFPAMFRSFSATAFCQSPSRACWGPVCPQCRGVAQVSGGWVTAPQFFCHLSAIFHNFPATFHNFSQSDLTLPERNPPPPPRLWSRGSVVIAHDTCPERPGFETWTPRKSCQPS